MKTCSKCNTDSDNFAKSSRLKDGLQRWCRSCTSEYGKQRWADPDKRSRKNDLQIQRRQLLTQQLVDYKKQLICDDCGNDDWRVLEFDHLGDKEYNISDMVSAGFGWDRVLAEISKCAPVCANCHRIRIWTRRNTTSCSAAW